jgi:glucose-6-phosphate isomerase
MRHDAPQYFGVESGESRADKLTAVDITSHPAWQRLTGLAKSRAATTLRDAFASDPGRAKRLAFELVLGGQADSGALYIDISKQLISDEMIAVFAEVIEAAAVAQKRDAMFSGAPINNTEYQPALHTALRAPRGAIVLVDGRDVVADVHRVRDELASFAARVQSGEIRGATGKAFTHVLNIGIGGSDLGPALVYEALSGVHQPKLKCCFVSNIDATDLLAQLHGLNAETTLVVMISKTFSTAETLANSRLAQQWLGTALGDSAISRHSIVVSAYPQRALQHGIAATQIFETWAWVGGRYSVSSAVSAANVLAFGGEVFSDFLAGMHAVDTHFATASSMANAPMLLAMIDVVNTAILGMATRAVLPYSSALALLPAYLQQLEMESNGKRVTSDGQSVSLQTSAVVWGGVGTDAQHAFIQMLHQGTQVVPADFIFFSRPSHRYVGTHDALVANALAQAQVLAVGRTAAELRSAGVSEEQVAHRVMPGNRPSTTIVGSVLNAASLGALIALYEHKVFVAGCVLGINSFDQWGVEMGKQLAGKIANDIESGEPSTSHDSSTRNLLRWHLSHRNRGGGVI